MFTQNPLNLLALQFWFISNCQCLPMLGGGYPSISTPPPHGPYQPGLQWQQNRLTVENSSPDSEWVDYTFEDKSQPFTYQNSFSPWSPDYRFQHQQTNNNDKDVKFERFSPDWPHEVFGQYLEPGLAGEVESSGQEQGIASPVLDRWDDVQDGWEEEDLENVIVKLILEEARPVPIETSSHHGHKLSSNSEADYIVASDVDTSDLLLSIASLLDTETGELKDDEQMNKVVPQIVLPVEEVVGDSSSTSTVDHCIYETSDPCGPNTLCHSTFTGPVCSCLPGFVVDWSSSLCLDVGDAMECRYVDECLEDESLCGGQGRVCSNTDGGYVCKCKNGFVVNANTEECDDVNECLEEADACEDNAICENSLGSYSCQCKPGYTSDQPQPGTGSVTGCRDVDECLSDPGLCGDKGICYNVGGSYLCRCRVGFVRDYATDMCVDINECLDKAKDVCSDNSDCVNTAGSFTCECRSGYSGDPELGCQDDDECSLSPPVCGERTECQNIQGSFSCSCKEGFEGEPPSVPCHQNEKVKSELTDSMPTLGRTKCMSDMDCLTDSLCKVGECRCKVGYTESEFQCVDKNECELVPGICSQNSVCRNLAGGYLCRCKEGFARYPPSYTCSQVNKCMRECGDKAECRDGEGEYLCVCDQGYVELLGGGCVEE